MTEPDDRLTSDPAWMDLTDDELRSRLMSRGFAPPILDWFLDQRETEAATRAITDILGWV